MCALVSGLCSAPAKAASKQPGGGSKLGVRYLCHCGLMLGCRPMWTARAASMWAHAASKSASNHSSIVQCVPSLTHSGAAAAGLALWMLHRRRQAAQLGSTAAAGWSAADGSGCSGGSVGSSCFQLGSKELHIRSGWCLGVDVSEPPPPARQLPNRALTRQLNENGARAQQEQQRSNTSPSGSPALSDHSARSSLGGGAKHTASPQPAAQQAEAAAALSGGDASLQALARQVSAASALSWGSSGTVDIAPWLLPFSELDLGRRIGDGSYGTVFLAHWHQVRGTAGCNCSAPATCMLRVPVECPCMRRPATCADHHCQKKLSVHAARPPAHVQSEVAVKVLHGAGRDEELTLSNPLLAGLLVVSAVLLWEKWLCARQTQGSWYSRS